MSALKGRNHFIEVDDMRLNLPTQSGSPLKFDCDNLGDKVFEDGLFEVSEDLP
jgi:hypothetical protein